jgi:hypothetical protein
VKSRQPGCDHLPRFRFSPLAAGILLMISATGFSPAWAGNPAGHWSSDFNRPGIYGDISATVEYNGDLIVAGRFEIPGTPLIRNIARWDGRQWRNLGNGLTGDELYERKVSCLLVFQGELIAGGDFQRSGDASVEGLARWDGSDWRGFESGPRSAPADLTSDGHYGTEVRALLIHEGRLTVAGSFDSAGSAPASNIAVWDGKGWSALGNGQGHVYSMSLFSGELIANAAMPVTNPTPRTYLHRWDGTTWSPLPGAAGIFAYAMVVYNDRLVVGGGFQRKRGATRDIVVAWDGAVWHDFTPGLSVTPAQVANQPYGVSALSVHYGALIVGGAFSLDGVTPEHLVRWNGAEWSSLEPNEDHFFCCSSVLVSGVGEVTTLGFHDGDIVVAGHFDTLGANRVNNIARWDGRSFHAYGCGGGRSPGAFERLASWNDSIVAGAHPVSLWKENGWSALGDLNGRLFDILVHENSVVAATGEDDPILLWTGHSWVPLGHEFFAVDLQIYDDALVGSGHLDSDVSGNSSVARWDGNAWQRIGTPFTGEPWRLTVFRGDLFATINRFAPSSSGGQLVRWTGAEWEDLGSTGPAGWIYDLAVFENELVAAGFFLEMDGVPARNIARWNGERWAPLGEGVAAGEAEGAIYSVEPYGDRLAVGGRLRVAGTIPAGNIAFWDGFDWTAAGSGTDGLIWDLEVLHSDLYAVGLFTLAGDQPSYGIARWTPTPGGNQCFPLTPLALAPAYPNPFRESTRVDYSLAERGHSRITVVDVLGRPVVELVNKVQAAGAHSIAWDGCDREGRKVPSGVYYMAIENGRTSGARKVIRVR